MCVVQVVGLAKNELMTHTLVDFLMGETDNVPKDPHYIFQLYMALGNYAQVCTVVRAIELPAVSVCSSCLSARSVAVLVTVFVITK